MLARCRKGSQGSALARGLLSKPIFHCKGLGGPFELGDSFQMLVVVAKGPKGSHLLEGFNSSLTLAGIGPEGPAAFVSCQKSPFCGDYVLGHGTFVAFPTIMRWGTVGSMLGARFNLNSLD